MLNIFNKNSPLFPVRWLIISILFCGAYMSYLNYMGDGFFLNSSSDMGRTGSYRYVSSRSSYHK